MSLSRRAVLQLLAAQAVLPLRSLRSEMTVLAAESARPPFSWDRVPVYQDLGKPSGDFTKAEAQFLAAHYGFISIEKGQGLQQYGSTEAGAAAAVRQLKSINPNMCVLYYWNGALDYVDLYAATKSGLPTDFFLKKLDGQYWDARPGVHRYDLSNPAMRQWWLDNAVKNVTGAPYDGIFVDAIPQVADRVAGLEKAVGAQKAVALQRGLVTMLEQLKQKLGPDKIIIFNGLRYDPSGCKDGGVRFLNYTSGAMIEHFGFLASDTPADMAGDIDLARDCARKGKITIFKGWPSFSWLETDTMKQPHDVLHARSARDITFPLACFLICAGEYAYFDYSWGYKSDMGGLDWYPEFNKALGPPKGEAARERWKYHREFEHASVSVDLSSKAAHIDWR